ncbi:MAG: phosphoribosylformylglycinamidine synthase subunit PurL [Planctomycetes bacterium]|nr:phosphoribosylformylglycinamidine synthase subunit PurL [Planctomycetota bacterium]
MLFKIRLTPKLKDQSPESLRAARTLHDVGLHSNGLVHRRLYLIEGKLSEADAKRVATGLLADPVTESAEVFKGDAAEPEGERLFNIMRRTGVMDPVEQSLMRALSDSGVNAAGVKSVDQFEFAAPITPAEVAKAYAALGNSVVDEAHRGPLLLKALPKGKPYAFKLLHIDITGLTDEGLKILNGTHKLSMNLTELRAVQAFFKEQGREPTDAELLTLAQTWSEHCKHKTLAGQVHYREHKAHEAGPDSDLVHESLFDMKLVPLDGKIDNLLKDTIKRVTDELNHPWCLSVFVDNAGVIEFDAEDAICFKVETHNHPSAIEPYGGAGTGLGGVIRDILGTGLGARPILNTNVFCFGPLDADARHVPKGATHPRKIMRGVVNGVRDYGNRMGIPTPNGGVHFDARYTGNPLVYAGSVGIIPRDRISKKAEARDVIVVAGGRTGRDGIGGATFSSVELTSESETISAGAVQIGNAIAEQMVQECLIKARDKGLYRAVTDCGAGGLSSAVGEMGEHTGAAVELHKVPVKYEGLSYAEVWLSEAQERMVFAVPPHKLSELLDLFKSEDVEATAIGEFTGDGRLKLHWQGKEVCDMPMSFVHDGMPKVAREAVWQSGVPRGLPEPTVKGHDANEILRAILGSPNVCSKEWVVRQYDHEVQAMSAIKPFTGPGRDGPSDACAIVPKLGGKDAVVVSNGLNTRFGDVDPFWMAQSNIDEALRNYVCAGGDIEHCAILDNFSWGNCNKPDRLGGLVRACYGCYVAARAFGTPFISGKDSLNNEFMTDLGVSVAIPPTLLISAIGKAVSLDGLTTMDLKQPGHRLFVIGQTRDEFAGSHFEMVTGVRGSEPPRLDASTALRCYKALNECQRKGQIKSAHDCSEGGIAVALAEMALAGRLGVKAKLDAKLAPPSAEPTDATLLFSESNGRIIIEVAAKDAAAVWQAFNGLPIVEIGEVTREPRLLVAGMRGQTLIDQDAHDLARVFKEPLYKAFGEGIPKTPA